MSIPLFALFLGAVLALLFAATVLERQSGPKTAKPVKFRHTPEGRAHLKHRHIVEVLNENATRAYNPVRAWIAFKA